MVVVAENGLFRASVILIDETVLVRDGPGGFEGMVRRQNGPKKTKELAAT